MTQAVMLYEPLIRGGAFFGVLLAMALWEVAAPKRPAEIGRKIRWTSNLGLVALDTILVRIAFPVGAVSVALMAEGRAWGILGAVDLPRGLEILIAVVLLDAAIWAQHVVFHKAPLFWRLHRVHHVDVHMDTTTGVRFHPIEILISMAIKILLVSALGAAPEAVVIFEVLLNATALFNHGNVRLPLGVDRVLRLVMVTPDMHRVHHSVIRTETDSNYGFALSVWDRLFGTYTPQPAGGHDAMTIGQESWREASDQGLGRLLLQPFKGVSGR